MRRFSAFLFSALAVAVGAMVIFVAPAAILEAGDAVADFLVVQPIERIVFQIERFSPYPTANWVTISDPPLRPLTTTDTHYLVADAACTVTAIATDADCWSHTSGGAGGAGVPGSGNAAISDASSGAGSFTVDANMNVASWAMTGFTGTLNMGATTLTVNGSLTLAGTFNRNTSTVVFAATGTLTMTANNIDRSLYNMTINTGVTVTNATNGSWVSNLLTVNGTLVAASPSPAQRIINVSGEVATTPVVIGAAGDLDSSGYFIYRLRGPCSTTYTITSGTYQHVAILAGNSTCAYTANLGGNMTTTACGIFRDCAFLASSEATLTPAAQFTFNTQNFNLTVGGIYWMGDGTTTGGTFNQGSSTIVTEGFTPTGNNVVVNLNSATITSGPQTGTSDGFSADEPLCFSGSGTVTVNFNTSNFTCDGQFRIFASGTFNLNSSTITVTDNRGCNNCAGVGYPGEFNIVTGATVNMGSATITVDDRWTNNATNVATHDRGTSTVRLWWDFSNAAGTDSGGAASGHYFVGPTNLAEAEFYNLEVMAVGTGTRTIVAINDSPPWGPVWVENQFRIYDTDGGITNLNMQNQNITSNGTLSVEANATLTMGTGDILDFNRLDVDGTLSMNSITVANIDLSLTGTDTTDITAWTAYDLTAASFDVQWTLGPVSNSATTLTIVVGELTHTVRTDYTLARGSTNVREERVGLSETVVTFRLAGGWGSTDAMAITAANAPPEGSRDDSLPGPILPAWVVVVLLGAVFVVYYNVRSRRRRRRK